MSPESRAGSDPPSTQDSGPSTRGYLIVARVRRAHGLKGELLVEAITTDPGVVLAEGRLVIPGTTSGDVSGGTDGGSGEPGTRRILRSRPTNDGWILALEGIADRDTAESWRGRHLLAPFGELVPPDPDEVYVHEIVGMTLRDATGASRGVVAGWYEVPQGMILEVDSPGGRFDLPFNAAFVTRVDRANRTMTVDLPDDLPLS